MKKTINHVTYNTDTADFIKEVKNGYFPTDFNYEYRALCRTPKGSYFLYCEGGARTRWAKRLENGWYRAGERIIPLSDNEASAWMSDPWMDMSQILYWLEH